MSRVRIPLLFLNVLLFASVGIVVGGVLFLGMVAMLLGDPRAALVPLWIPVEAMSGGLYLGGAPAVVTGLVAALLRSHVRRLPVLAMVMAPIGAGITAIYLALIGIKSGDHHQIGILSLVWSHAVRSAPRRLPKQMWIEKWCG